MGSKFTQIFNYHIKFIIAKITVEVHIIEEIEIIVSFDFKLCLKKIVLQGDRVMSLEL